MWKHEQRIKIETSLFSTSWRADELNATNQPTMTNFKCLIAVENLRDIGTQTNENRVFRLHEHDYACREL